MMRNAGQKGGVFKRGLIANTLSKRNIREWKLDLFFTLGKNVNIRHLTKPLCPP
ncbi:hypothetical protein BABINDRAFT_147592 [Babjeviella inositovora NRRL Y-12698]|uniref:Uncharacterized protein n=1 Tax=Babjeviella inositovora NRRL Y-12698 TaxID=984486 RepID=A0A1E3QN07_9ASCO|nr:uncharacterized protein BABINDRAFT_147592 [Babjeviella inositovora NRRL Y-12698]ODQ79063.1 hypothetical protein BABINDRAFT_147592 [Babjeviella inositovora NRRL Y-12698]